MFGTEKIKVAASLGLVECPHDVATEVYLDWMKDIFANTGISWNSRLADGSIEEACNWLMPTVAPVHTKVVFCSTKSPWTLFLDNRRFGTDANSPGSVIARKTNSRFVRAVSKNSIYKIENGKRKIAQYGAQILQLWGADGESFRSIYAMNDGGRWRFDATGETLVGEDESTYNERKISSRFTHGNLVSVLDGLGARPFDQDWYGSKYCALERVGDEPGLITEYD